MKVNDSIYMDYQATTPLDPAVRAEMDSFNDAYFANPHSVQHFLGQQVASAVDSARTRIEALIGASSEEVIFTSGATEANNQIIATAMLGNSGPRRRILISSIEHKCIKNAAYFYADKLGYQVDDIPVLATGMVDIEAYKQLLADDVLLVCVMAVNNEIGTIQDIPELSRLAHNMGAMFHCDAAQAPEALDIDVAEWGVDTLSLSAHKVYGPKGIGALYMSNRLQASLPPFILGGGQQSGMRSGTVPAVLCVGFAKALEVSKQLSTNNRKNLLELKDYFIQQLSSLGIEYKLNGDQTRCHPGTLNLQFIGQNATQLLERLQPNICASTGSACNSEMVLLSHVLKAIGLSDEQAVATIRFGLGRFTNTEQIDQTVKLIKKHSIPLVH